MSGLIVLGGLFPRPLLQVMEPSVKSFIADFHRRVAEPDCATPHIFGQACKP